MHSFTLLGKSFNLVINVQSIRKVKGDCDGLELSDLHGGTRPMVLRLQDQVTLLVDVVWSLVSAQAANVQMSRETFEKTLGGVELAAISDAFWGELSDFFRPFRPSEANLIDELRQDSTPAATSNGATASPESSESTPQA